MSRDRICYLNGKKIITRCCYSTVLNLMSLPIRPLSINFIMVVVVAILVVVLVVVVVIIVSFKYHQGEIATGRG